MLNKVEHDLHRLLVGDPIGDVDRRAFEIAGDAALADALGDRGALALEDAAGVIGVERRAEGIGEGDLDIGIALLERHADARQRAARSDRADEAVDLAVRLSVNLGTRRFVMAAAVGDVVELVRPHRPVGLRLRQHFSQAAGIFDVIVGVGIGDRRHLDELRADQPQHVLLFLRLRVGDHDHAAEAERRRDHADADAGVAGGPLDDYAASPQLAARHSVLDDGERRAVLDRSAGIHELGLTENGAAGRLGSRPEPDQGCVADRFDDGGAVGHDVLFLSIRLSDGAPPDKNAAGACP